MQPLPTTKSCFVCGQQNPLGLRLHFETDGRIAQTRFAFRPEHAGFQNVVHGGLISTILDEVMVWACGVQTQKFAYCVELKVKFLQPTRPNTLLQATGHLIENRKNRIFNARAELKTEDHTVLAASEGVYFPLKEHQMKELIAELEWDPTPLLQTLSQRSSPSHSPGANPEFSRTQPNPT